MAAGRGQTNLCTIVTADWVDLHLRRWARYAAKNSPQTPLGLLAIGEGGNLDGIGPLDKVVLVDSPEVLRPFLNEIRMDFPALFGPCIYCDCDADVFTDLGGLADLKSPLACCRSPAMHEDWGRVWDALQLGPEIAPEMNNGFLVMKRSFLEEYHRADDALSASHCEVNPRIRGQMIFNLMLRKVCPADWEELPPEISAVWWDKFACLKASVIQYCNDHGQRKRVELEQLWRAVNP